MVSLPQATHWLFSCVQLRRWAARCLFILYNMLYSLVITTLNWLKLTDCSCSLGLVTQLEARNCFGVWLPILSTSVASWSHIIKELFYVSLALLMYAETHITSYAATAQVMLWQRWQGFSPNLPPSHTIIECFSTHAFLTWAAVWKI